MKRKLLAAAVTGLCVLTCTVADVVRWQAPLTTNDKGEVSLRAFVGWGGLLYVSGHEAYDDEEAVDTGGWM